MINALDFGLREGSDVNGVANRIALQAAIDTGENVYVPTGSYNLEGSILFKQEGQVIYGDGRYRTKFAIQEVSSIQNEDNSSGFIDSNGKRGIEIRSLSVDFAQNQSATDRSELVKYNSAIHIDSPRVIIEDVIVSNATSAIKATGNFGGLHLERVEASAFEIAFDLGYSDSNAFAKDSVTLSAVRSWPHNLSASLKKIADDGKVTGFAFGNIDDFKGQNIFAYRTKVVVDGDEFDGIITNIAMEGAHSTLQVTGSARLQINALSASSRATGPSYEDSVEPKIQVLAGAELEIVGAHIRTNLMSSPVVYVDHRDAEVSFYDGKILQPNPDGQAFLLESGRLEVDNIRFPWEGWGAKRDYMIVARGDSSYLKLNGNSMGQKPYNISGNGGFLNAKIPLENLELGENFVGHWGTQINPHSTSLGRSIQSLSGHDVIRGSGQSDSIDGGAGNDSIVGRSGSDFLSGSHGDDTIFGQLDDDLIDGGLGSDRLFGGQGSDTLQGGEGNDVVFGRDGTDYIIGDSEDDRLFGQNGEDVINGGAGEDTIQGGRGDDVVIAGEDNDAVYGGAGSDILDGSKGDDRIFGGNGNDIITGAVGNDSISGFNGNDSLNGGVGSDTLYGGNGDDIFQGGRGDDVMIGQRGRDIYYLSPGLDIAYFENNIDKVSLKDYNDLNMKEILRFATQHNSGVQISIEDSSLMLLNMKLSLLDGRDFVF